MSSEQGSALMDLIPRARELRSNPTDAERRLWRALRQRRLEGYKFRRQVPLGPYIVDFMCREQRLVIEVDGAQHAEQVEYDRARDTWLATEGFRVLRFTDREVLMELDSVEEAIWVSLQWDSRQPPP